MTDMKALRVVIGLKPNGQAEYPDFNLLPVVQDAGIDWSYYINSNSLGWAYDKTSGHSDEDVDSPRGTQLGVLVVEPQFADQAVNLFPATCSIISEPELRTFWQEKAFAHLEEEETDEQVITNFKNIVDLLKDLEANPEPGIRKRAGASASALPTVSQIRRRVRKALDPDDPAPGLRRNIRKRWNLFRDRKGINIIP